MKKTVIPLLFIATFAACTSSEIGNSKDVNPETIYTQYHVYYNEGDNDVNCRAQFRFGGNKGTTLVLNNPAQVSLDEQVLKVDSNKAEGAYYNTTLPLAGFTGKHVWLFADINKKEYKEDFVFTPFRLKTVLPTTINKQDLTLEFAGLQNESQLNISIIDTSAATQNIDGKFTIIDNRITIKSDEISKLKAGPLDIEIGTNTNHNLKNTTKEGGEISIVYKLKTRKTVLKN